MVKDFNEEGLRADVMLRIVLSVANCCSWLTWQIGDGQFCGLLKKLGDVNRTFKERWFVLQVSGRVPRPRCRPSQSF